MSILTLAQLPVENEQKLKIGFPPAGAYVPQVQYMSPNYRIKLISSGKAIHISMPSRVKDATNTRSTHVHILNHDNGPDLIQVEIIPSYSPSVTLAYGDKNIYQRSLVRLRNAKWCLGGKDILSLAIGRFSEDSHSADTIYSFTPGLLDSQSSYTIHEAVRRFFCNRGYVPATDIHKSSWNGVVKTNVSVRYKSSPNWLQKLSVTTNGHKDCLIPAEPAETCSMCRPCQSQNRAEMLPFLASTPQDLAAFGSRTVVHPEHLERERWLQAFSRNRKLDQPQSEQRKSENMATAWGDRDPNQSNVAHPSPTRTLAPEEGSKSVELGAAGNDMDRGALQVEPRAAETTTDVVSWEIPEASTSSLGEVTISHFILAFVKLNGKETFTTASARDISRIFNQFIDKHYPGSSFEDKLGVLRRVSGFPAFMFFMLTLFEGRRNSAFGVISAFVPGALGMSCLGRRRYKNARDGYRKRAQPSRF